MSLCIYVDVTLVQTFIETRKVQRKTAAIRPKILQTKGRYSSAEQFHRHNPSVPLRKQFTLILYSFVQYARYD